MSDQAQRAPWSRAAVSERGAHEAHMDTTSRQVTERMKATRAAIAAAEAQLATLTALREAMRSAGAATVGDLSAEDRLRHCAPIRAVAGRTGGVELW